METASSSSEQVAALAGKIVAQKSAVGELNALLKETAYQTLQHDQIEALDTLKRRVADEARDLMESESSTAYAATKVSLATGVGGLVFGSLAASLSGHKDPVSIGLKVSRQMLERKTPSGNIVVSVGGEPARVRAISISELARDSRRSEAEASAPLRKQGYLLISVQQFNQVTDVLKTQVTSGTIELPLNIEAQIIKVSKDKWTCASP